MAKRKSLYYQLVDEFHRGNIVPYLARNVGVWAQKSNTLSILDMTLVFPLEIEHLKKQLTQVFLTQAKQEGYGKEVLSFTCFICVQIKIDYNCTCWFCVAKRMLVY